MSDDCSESVWDMLDSLEDQASSKLSPKLAPLAPAVAMSYELGMESALLPADRRGGIDLAVSGLYLKRALTDLRALWLLTVQGYTAQAATVATSLFENALAAEVTSGNVALANGETARQIHSRMSPNLPRDLQSLLAIPLGIYLGHLDR